MKIESAGITIWDEMALINAIIGKHRKFLDVYAEEFADLDSRVSELKESSTEEKRERDEINSHVAELKEGRQLLYHTAKQLRIEMFDLININRDMHKNEQEMAQLQKEVEALDWRLQTTVMGIQKEREIVEKIKKLSLKIEELNESRPVDVNDETVKQLSSKIKEGMDTADRYHRELVAIANQSQEHHGSFVGYVGQLKEIRGRHIWLKNRIKSHEDAASYWDGKRSEMVDKGDNGD